MATFEILLRDDYTLKDWAPKLEGYVSAWTDQAVTVTPSAGTHTLPITPVPVYRSITIGKTVTFTFDYTFTQTTSNAFAFDLTLVPSAKTSNFAFSIWVNGITTSTYDVDVTAHTISAGTKIQVYKNSQYIATRQYRVVISGSYEIA